jgi:fructoselysine-6-P-deglycase FrlB-like protein
MHEAIANAIEAARTSDYFSGARLADEFEQLLAERAGDCAAVADELGTGIEQLFLVGSGGSYADAMGVKYTLDHLLTTPVDAVPSYELLWRNPRRLDDRALAAFISLSGETEDTVAALRHARARGARTIAVVRDEDSTLGREADIALPFKSSACYEAPVALLTLLGARLAELQGAQEEAALLTASLHDVPAVVRRAMELEEAVAEEKARRFLHAGHLVVVGGGPLSSLAYKLALTVVMENVRIFGTYCDASEFRHGPAEALERTSPDMLFLVGTDASRELTLRTLDFCQRNGAHALVYDAADTAPDLHPLLTGLVLNPLTQWFVVHSAILRGILDLDDRVFMGHNVLATGGARWP